MNEYNLGNFIIKHYDLYRLNSSDELNNLNLFNNDDEISIIEWPQIIKKKPKLLTEIYFEYENEYQNRSLKILN